MFNELTEAIQAEIVTAMFHVQVQQQPPPPPQRVDRGGRPSGPGQPPSRNGDGRGAAVPVGAAVGEVGKVGRNDPCPCGSGLKYKKCHGR